MARPLKLGLDYFPMDVNFFTDDKIAFVSARFEEKGELIAAKLLCRIYSLGYCTDWNEDISLLFARSAGKNITHGLVNDVVNELLKRGFFCKDIYKRFNILTSNGIQKRYTKICKDSNRKGYEIPEKHLVKELSAENELLSPDITMESTDESTQSKVKESKGNKSKVKEIKIEIRPHVFLSDTEIFKLKEEYNHEDCEWMYDKLNNYKLAKGTNYKSDYGAICSWVKKSLKEEKEKNSVKKETGKTLAERQAAAVEGATNEINQKINQTL